MSRPKGLAKTGGRTKGTPNKATSELQGLAQQYTEHAIKVLAMIMVKGESEQARIAAARELLDRGHGKATQVIAGEGGGALQSHIIVSFVATKQAD